jgi:hypothetical protein
VCGAGNENAIPGIPGANHNDIPLSTMTPHATKRTPKKTPRERPANATGANDNDMRTSSKRQQEAGRDERKEHPACPWTAVDDSPGSGQRAARKNAGEASASVLYKLEQCEAHSLIAASSSPWQSETQGFFSVCRLGSTGTPPIWCCSVEFGALLFAC